MISALVVATNEEADIGAALKSLRGIVEEILLVDGGSEDQTMAIAKSYEAKILERKFDNFTEQRQFGLKHASQPWILSLDADERVTLELAREIEEAVRRKDYAGYKIPFEVEFMGRILRFSGRQGENHLRLFQKDRVSLVPDLSVHERYRVAKGKVGQLQGKIRHRPYKDLADYLRKCEAYAALSAHDFIRSGRRLTWRFRWIPSYEFFKTYFFQLGFLDGFPGFVWAFLSAYHRHLRYQKVRHLIQVGQLNTLNRDGEFRGQVDAKFQEHA